MRSHSTKSSRREFLLQAGAAASALLMSTPGGADAAHVRKSRPSSVGLQLFTVSESLEKNFEATLQSIHQIGYREVETAGALHRSAALWRTSLKNVGLHCASVHLAGDDPVPAMMDFAKELGAAYAVTALYMLKPTPDDASYRRMLANLTLDDYKRMAEQCNRLGEQAKQRNLQLAYHNENVEFEPESGQLGYDTLLAETDADLVKLELDCGWMIAAGHDPIEYLIAHPDRYRMLHVKDFKAVAKPTYGLVEGDSPESAELGRGIIDYVPIIKAARRAGVEYYFVEEEPPFVTPVIQALAIDYKYTKTTLAR
ncbi:MAG: Xylose isomerase protein barrel [Gammaproteobacteria bacterium]|nr:Xylose isomerase protein barrel [Gammaproteobacteria bacterium]